jgi:hypothetical protein
MSELQYAQPAQSDQPFGFPIRLFTYKKSIEKAAKLNPEIQYLSNDASFVQCSDNRSFVRVKFLIHDHELHAVCSCFAAFKAQPCYHIAAAAMQRGVLSTPIETVHQVAEQIEKDFDFSIKYEIDDTVTFDTDADFDQAQPFPTNNEIEEMAIQENRFQPSKIQVEQRRDWRGVELEYHTINGWEI